MTFCILTPSDFILIVGQAHKHCPPGHYGRLVVQIRPFSGAARVLSDIISEAVGG